MGIRLLLLPPLHWARVLQECHCARSSCIQCTFDRLGSRGCQNSNPSCGRVMVCASVCTHLCISGRTGKVTESHPRVVSTWWNTFSFCLASRRLSSCQQNAKSFAAVMAPRSRWYLELVTLGFKSWGSFGCFLPKIWLLAAVLKEPCSLQVSWGK